MWEEDRQLDILQERAQYDDDDETEDDSFDLEDDDTDEDDDEYESDKDSCYRQWVG